MSNTALTTSQLIQTPHIVAFLDFLGAKEKMANPRGSDDFLQKINRIYRIADKLIGNKKTSKLKVKIFSDNILAACEIKNLQSRDECFEAFFDIQFFCLNFQACALLEGLWVRGGVSYGNMFMNEKFAFGDGLIKSYKIESESAIYPRIVIDRQIFYKLGLNFQILASVVGNYQSLKRDNDGEIYFFPFSRLFEVANSINLKHALRFIKQDILTEYQRLDAEKHFKLFPKYYWLASKFNNFCEDIQKEDYKILINDNGELVAEDEK